MKVKDFDAQARYDHWIVKEVDDRGELIHIRFVEDGMDTHDLLRKNGYEKVFSGCRADGFQLPGYSEILVKRNDSSEGVAGTIVATRTNEVFDKDGLKLGVIWDTKDCGVGGLSYEIIQRGNEFQWLQVIWLEDKYVEFFEKLKDVRWMHWYHTKITYQQVRDIVDSGKAEEVLKKAENPQEIPW